MPYRVIITGCRKWVCWHVAREVLARLVARHGEVTIVQGAADGVDYAFAETGFDNDRISVASFPADWEEHGKKAGPIRNREMVASGADLCIAVHKDLKGSKGTKDCVKQCLASGIPVWLIDSDEVKPVRIAEL